MIVIEQDTNRAAVVEGLRGDAAELAARLGDAGGLGSAGAPALAASLGTARDIPSLRKFLHAYRDEVLLPRELPWILEAWRCADRFQPRELIELDRRLTGEVWIKGLAVASRHVGRSQLRALKPLRDLRLVRRYREAVQAGLAQGWHLIVYGLVLHTYSIPLRPGLAGYGLQTLEGFLDSASRPLPLSMQDRAELLEELVLPLAGGVNRLLPRGPGPG